MDWIELAETFFDMALGMLLLLWFQKRDRKRTHPYRYSCPMPECVFMIEGNELSTVDAYITKHEVYHRNKEA